ncbi:MAG: hypothetical protein WAO58_06600 [Fimbriimonadaceae bacterium]
MRWRWRWLSSVARGAILGALFLFLWLVVGPLIPFWEFTSHLEESRTVLVGLGSLVAIELINLAFAERIIPGLARLGTVILLTILPPFLGAVLNEFRVFAVFGVEWMQSSSLALSFTFAVVCVYGVWPVFMARMIGRKQNKTAEGLQ